MAVIKVLDKHIAELIAAGEVVERPSSVIKELVENSIDAGATVITVEISNGGVTFMRVKDNGCGIQKEYVTTAFLRHATSKIQEKIDLDAIGTLGFRGEALASISAVSHMELFTKTEEEEIGTRVLSDGGDITEVSDAGCPKGTTIIVRDIFYNIPARMKFLKKDVTEGNSVAGIMDKVALSHPEISFRLIRDNKEILHTPGDNKMKSAIYSVFGKGFSTDLIPVDYTLNDIHVWGYITSPAGARANRTMQNFFINGRYIRSRTANVALEEAFKGSVLVGKFPGCVLHMSMNCSAVDVNVHPAKLEVRFVNERPIFDVVYHGVKSALMKGDKPKEMPRHVVNSFPVEKEPEQLKINKPIVTKQNVVSSLPVSYANSTDEFINRVRTNVMMDSESKPSIKESLLVKSFIENVLDEEIVPMVENKPKQETRIAEMPVVSHMKTSFIVAEEKTEVNAQDSIKVDVSEVSREETVFSKIIGEAFDTYIIIQYGNNKLMLIDKHAAHERLLYEKLKREKEGLDAQQLLVPITVTLDKKDYNSVLLNLEKFMELGFEIDDFGNGTVIVRTAPLILDNGDVASSVEEIANHLTDMKKEIETEYMDWIYHNIACRAAIKGGNKSSSMELVDLAKKLEENPEIRYCPHGRPIYTIIKKYDIEKQFGRV